MVTGTGRMRHAEWMPMLPAPTRPLSGQSAFGQHAVDGSMRPALLAV